MRISAVAGLVLASVCCAQSPVYKDPAAALDRRVEDLLGRMTLEEKISQLMNDSPAIERLGVPRYNWWNESLHGVARAGRATVFPQAIGLAATWDTDLMFRVATAISDEARAKYHEFLRRDKHDIYQGLTFWTPNINLFRDPRWGRGMETYGEDPYLTGRMAVAFIKGMQGDDPKYLKTVATAKHFAVHSGPEPARHTFDAVVSENDLRETYLPHFEAAIREGGAYSVMCAYNSVDGLPACANPRLLEDILRKEWGFQGYVVSDCGAIGDIYLNHKKAPNAEAGVARAIQQRSGRPAQRAAGRIRCRQGSAPSAHGAIQARHVRSAGDGQVRADPLFQRGQPGAPPAGARNGAEVHRLAQERPAHAASEQIAQDHRGDRAER
jgi:beta-glucosidase